MLYSWTHMTTVGVKGLTWRLDGTKTRTETYKNVAEVTWRLNDAVCDVVTMETASAAPACFDLYCLATVERVNKAAWPTTHCRRTEDLVFNHVLKLHHLTISSRQNSESSNLEAYHTLLISTGRTFLHPNPNRIKVLMNILLLWCVRLSIVSLSVTLCIVAKRCILEQKLLDSL